MIRCIQMKDGAHEGKFVRVPNSMGKFNFADIEFVVKFSDATFWNFYHPKDRSAAIHTASLLDPHVKITGTCRWSRIVGFVTALEAIRILEEYVSV